MVQKNNYLFSKRFLFMNFPLFRYFCRVFFFALILFIATAFFDKSYRFGDEVTKGKIYWIFNKHIDSTVCPVLGTSTTLCGVVPGLLLIDSSHVFLNYGISQTSLKDQGNLLRYLHDKYKIRSVILQLDIPVLISYQLHTTQDHDFYFYPYINDCRFNLTNTSMPFRLFSNLSYLIYKDAYITGSSDANYGPDGYKGKTGYLDESKFDALIKELNASLLHIDREQYNSLKDIVSFAKQNKIALILSVSPMPAILTKNIFEKPENRIVYDSLHYRLAATGLPLYEAREGSFTNSDFADIVHLNTTGSVKHTLLLREFLRQTKAGL